MPRLALLSLQRSTGRDESGFVLIPVVMAIALLSLVALIIGQGTRDDVRVAGVNQRRAEMTALADGMATLAIRRLAVSKATVDDRRPVKTDGTPLVCAIAGHAATITIQDAAGMVDLNKGSLDTLERLFAGVGVDREQAGHLAAAIVDFRDGDDEALPGGAEAAEYANAGLTHRPKNAPFANVDELDQVLGMTPELMAVVRPLVTVHASNGNVDFEVASEAVRALGLPSTVGAKKRGDTMVVRAAVDRPGVARVVREAVAGVSSRQGGGAIIRQWTNVDPGPGLGSAASGGLPSCLDVLL